jgi:hypothetical protein
VVSAVSHLVAFNQLITTMIRTSLLVDEDTIWFTLEDVLVGPLAQNDSRIVDYIKQKNYIHEPSKLAYNLTDPDDDPSMGQSTIVKNALRSMVSAGKAKAQCAFPHDLSIVDFMICSEMASSSSVEPWMVKLDQIL